MIRADSLHMVYLYAKDAVSAFGSWVQYLVSPAERVRRAKADAEWEAFMERRVLHIDDDTPLDTFAITERELPGGATETTHVGDDVTEREKVAINAASAAFHAAIVEALGTDDIYLHVRLGRYVEEDA